MSAFQLSSKYTPQPGSKYATETNFINPTTTTQPWSQWKKE